MEGIRNRYHFCQKLYIKGYEFGDREGTCRLLRSSPSKLSNENTDVLCERHE